MKPALEAPIDFVESRTASRYAAWLMLGGGLVVGLIAGLILFLGLPGAPAGGDAPAVSGPAPAPVAGAPAPDFSLENLAGDTVTLSGLRGQVVLINFWATWCGPCRFEMPAIQAEYAAHREAGFTVLAVNLDEPALLVQDFVDQLGLTFPVLLDPGARVNDLYRVRGYPTSFFVDAEGTVARVHIGLMSEGQLKGYLLELGLGE